MTHEMQAYIEARIADIEASVPEDTKRTRSTGVRATISSASSTSGIVGEQSCGPEESEVLFTCHIFDVETEVVYSVVLKNVVFISQICLQI